MVEILRRARSSRNHRLATQTAPVDGERHAATAETPALPIMTGGRVQNARLSTATWSRSRSPTDRSQAGARASGVEREAIPSRVVDATSLGEVLTRSTKGLVKAAGRYQARSVQR